MPYNEKKVAQLITRMPMAKWSRSGKEMIAFENGLFLIEIDVDISHKDIVYGWTRDICLYRLHAYFERKAK